MTTSAQNQFPKLDFTTFILSLSSASFLALQGEGAGSRPNLLLAKQNIDLLELMQEKTRGNLTQEESKLLYQLLFEVRIKFVEAQSRS